MELRIVPTFALDDQAWIRRSSISVPRFWDGHPIAPATGDVLRVGGRQFTIVGRVWEQDADGPLLRLYLSSGHAESDTMFG
ncbi:MAG: hypothetical protein JSR59_23255 [Proteobacteria bacterium]|nr:hypothetical protein [Pseudomonadota bacterium]